MASKDRLRKREKAVVWHLLTDGAAGSGMRRGLYTTGPATVHVLTASKQRLEKLCDNHSHAPCSLRYLIWAPDHRLRDHRQLDRFTDSSLHPVRMIWRRGGLHRCHAVTRSIAASIILVVRCLLNLAASVDQTSECFARRPVRILTFD
jgi:hypothetical protein